MGGLHGRQIDERRARAAAAPVAAHVAGVQL